MRNENMMLQQNLQAGSGATEQNYAQFNAAMHKKDYEIDQLRAQVQEMEEKFNFFA